MNFRAGRGEFNLVRSKNTIWLLETAVKLASYKEIGDRGMRVAERNVTDLISCDQRPSGKQKSLHLEQKNRVWIDSTAIASFPKLTIFITNL